MTTIDSVEQVLSTVKVRLGEAERVLEFTLHAVAKLKKLTGINLLDGGWSLRDPEALLHVLWAALITHDTSFDADIVDGKPSADLTKNLEQIGKWVTFSNFEQVLEAITHALAAAMPKSKAADGTAEGEAAKN